MHLLGVDTCTSNRKGDRMPKTLWGVFGLVIAMAVVAQGTQAADMGMADELKTAITHAGFAEKYDSMKEVSLHLHHVVNCLVGEGDPMFDKASGNPCQGQGKGIMPDIKAKMGQDQEYQLLSPFCFVY
jgi:hypothetical protein